MPGRSNSTHVNGAIDDDKTTSAMANPYETDPDVIPSDDPFLAQSIHYGRYTPKPHDFVPTPQHKHWHQSEPESKAFWEEFTREHCIPDNSLNLPGSREAFAVGGVIVRVDTDTTHGAASERFSCVNANEISAARKVEDALKDIGIAVPIIYFCGTVEGKNVTVESRIPGTSLDVAWRYFNTDQIMVLKNQCRQIIHHLATIDSASEEPSYVCRGLNSQSMPSTSDQERTILFAPRSSDEVLNLTHNDLTPANLIVKDDRIVGISGWRNCGYFGLERAKKVHQSLREWKCYGSDENRGASWIDIYDNGYDPSICGPLVSTEDDHSPVVKAEPSGTTIEKYPPSEDLNFKSMGYDGTGDYLSSKKLASLKNGGGISRASSADRSSPAASVKAPSNKKGSSAATKKGTAKKPVSRKRKANDADTESIDGRRSNTPASRAGKASGKKQSSVSIAGSPAPEDKKRRSRMQPRDDDEDEDVEDENELFCICRRPDNHTWMIGCDGECEDWFHGKCVNIDPRDAELIDKYICPSCSNRDLGFTTWKPMCRLPECRKPARVTLKKPSKYCSDEHGREFMSRHIRKSKLGSTRKGGGDLGSMGGILTPSDLKAAILGVNSIDEFHQLGNAILPWPLQGLPRGSALNVKTENPMSDSDVFFSVEAGGVEYSAEEATKISELRQRRENLLHRKGMLSARSTFVGLLRQRAKAIVEKLKQNEPKGGWKDICGFDARLAWADEEFDEWRLSRAGQRALEEGSPEAMAASFPSGTDADGDIAMDGDEKEGDSVTFITRGVCIKKRCERHKQWMKVQQQDIIFEQDAAEQDLVRLEQEARSVAERAVLRKWAEKENAPSFAQ